MSDNVTARTEGQILLDAYRTEFLDACVSEGMTEADAEECRADFEREHLADIEAAR